MAVRAQTDAHGWEIPRRGVGARHEWGVRLERAVESSRPVVAFHGAVSARECGVVCGRVAGLCRTGGFEDGFGGGEDWASVSGVSGAGE